MTTRAATTTTTLQPVISNLTRTRMLGVLLLAQFIIFLIPLIVLGSAIGWPASLGDPAAVMLPLLVSQADAVTLGYTGYFVSSLLLLPIAVLVGQLFDRTRYGGLVTLAIALGTIASFAKLLGIARWLLVMPTLATAYVDPASDAATRSAITVTYGALNAYAGGIGEILGVALFTGLWTLVVALLLLRSRRLPAWTGWFGLVAAACSLLLSLELVGIEASTALLIGQGVIWQLWMIALGIVLLVRPQPPKE